MNQARPLVPSRFVRPSIPRPGGGRDRAALVNESYEAIAEGSRSFAFASKLFDKPTRERVWMLYAWCRRCDDLADAQDMGVPHAVERSPDATSSSSRAASAASSGSVRPKPLLL